ncbi:hypothetical protein ACLKA6_010899 [Drosophila palustris]
MPTRARIRIQHKANVQWTGRLTVVQSLGRTVGQLDMCGSLKWCQATGKLELQAWSYPDGRVRGMWRKRAKSLNHNNASISAGPGEKRTPSTERRIRAETRSMTGACCDCQCTRREGER